jgi:hypothetical protein
MVGQSDWLPMMMAMGAFLRTDTASRWLRYDVGNQQVFDLGIWSSRASFLQAAQLQLIARSGFSQRGNGRIEVAVLLQQSLELRPQRHFLQGIHVRPLSPPEKANQAVSD